MPTEIRCPLCGFSQWNAVEAYTAMTPCRLLRDEDGVEIELDPRAEFVRDAATSVTLAYTCANELCGHTVAADEVGRMP